MNNIINTFYRGSEALAIKSAYKRRFLLGQFGGGYVLSLSGNTLSVQRSGFILNGNSLEII